MWEWLLSLLTGASQGGAAAAGAGAATEAGAMGSGLAGLAGGAGGAAEAASLGLGDAGLTGLVGGGTLAGPALGSTTGAASAGHAAGTAAGTSGGLTGLVDNIVGLLENLGGKAKPAVAPEGFSGYPALRGSVPQASFAPTDPFTQAWGPAMQFSGSTASGGPYPDALSRAQAAQSAGGQTSMLGGWQGAEGASEGLNWDNIFKVAGAVSMLKGAGKPRGQGIKVQAPAMSTGATRGAVPPNRPFRPLSLQGLYQ